MVYALVVNGAVVRTADTPPQVWTRPNGTVVAGYHLRPDLWPLDGWLPVENVGPQPGANQTGTEHLGVNGAVVERTWTNIADLPPSPRDLLIAAVDDAVSLDDLRTVVRDALTNGVI